MGGEKIVLRGKKLFLEEGLLRVGGERIAEREGISERKG